jgi:hypothetical protein
MSAQTAQSARIKPARNARGEGVELGAVVSGPEKEVR